MDRNKKTISATEKKGKPVTNYVVCESYKGIKSLSAIFKDIILSDLNKKIVG